VTTELVVGLISAGVAVTATVVTVWGQTRTARLEAKLARLQAAEERVVEQERTAARYLEPLIRAAYDLQSRFYNILEQGLLEAYFDGGDERERAYVIESTSYVIAQYFAWTEIVRRAMQYVDLAQDERTRGLTLLQDAIYSLFQSDRFERPLRIFSGEQRAIGERMIKEGLRGLEGIGYAEYLDLIKLRPDPIFEALRSEIRGLSQDMAKARPRLVAIQHALIDLLAFLDPYFIRSPAERRSKVPAR
jgi:hypothetical protein